MKKGNRFIQIHKEGRGLSPIKLILLDKETGVQYLLLEHGYSATITPLLDRDGKPLIGRSWSVEMEG
jgi:hypothetical protein